MAGNPRFSTSSNLLLCEDGKRLLAYPEACTTDRLNLPTTVQVISAHTFTAAPALQRIVTANTIPAKAEKEAFELKGVYAQVPTSALAAYRKAWGLPLLCVLNEGEVLNETVSSTLTADDAVEFRAITAACGTAPSLSENVPVWLTTKLPKDALSLIYFPTIPTMITLAGSTNDIKPSDCFYAWTLQDGVFAATTPETKGAYLLLATETAADKELTLRFSSFSAAPMPLTGLTGNGTNYLIDLTGCYVYDNATGSFTLTPDKAVTLAPFQGVLTSYPDCPAMIEGPDLGILGITDFTVPSSTDRPSYDLKGRPLSPLHPSEGVVITKNGKKRLYR